MINSYIAEIKVSVIITTYGIPLYLGKAIHSVLSQTFTSIELIVVDDNNPNTEARNLTERLVQEFIDSGYNLVYLRHKQNENGAVARNTGLKVASGKYIAFLDNDDEYFPERIEKCLKEIENSNVFYAGVYTGCEFRKGGKIYYVHSNIITGNFLVDTLACSFMFSSGSNIFMRKSVIDELNGFDESFLRHQDYEFLVRVFLRYSLLGISKVLLIKNNENLNLQSVEQSIEIKDQYLVKYKAVIESLHENERRYIYYKNYISIAEHALKSKNYPLSTTYYRHAKAHLSLSLKDQYRRFILNLLNLKKM